MLESVQDFIFPPTCPVCEKPIPLARPKTNCQICTSCDPDFLLNLQESHSLPCWKNLPRCYKCGDALEQDFCLSCLVAPLPFVACYSMWPYEGAAEKLIKKIKYAGNLKVIPYLAKQAARILMPSPEGSASDQTCPFQKNNWDAVVPVPSRRESILERGFQHMAIFSRLLAQELGCLSLETALSITDDSPRQASIDFEQRLIPAKLAVSGQSQLFENKSILLVDDVLTTGNTALACSSALEGSSSIHLFTLARSDNFNRNRLKISALNLNQQ